MWKQVLFALDTEKVSTRGRPLWKAPTAYELVHEAHANNSVSLWKRAIWVITEVPNMFGIWIHDTQTWLKPVGCTVYCILNSWTRDLQCKRVKERFCFLLSLSSMMKLEFQLQSGAESSLYKYDKIKLANGWNQIYQHTENGECHENTNVNMWIWWYEYLSTVADT